MAFANNDLGMIVGEYTDVDIVAHSFLRTPDGHITRIDAPGAGHGKNLDEGTFAYAINDLGVIVGQYQDIALLFHGFIRYPDGKFKTFKVQAAGTGAGQGTLFNRCKPERHGRGHRFDPDQIHQIISTT
jgi:hypothetical protein